MELFKIKDNKIETVELKPFKLERDIQNLIEANTQELFQLELVRGSSS